MQCLSARRKTNHDTAGCHVALFWLADICDGAHSGDGEAAVAAHPRATGGCAGRGRLHPDHRTHLLLPV